MQTETITVHQIIGDIEMSTKSGRNILNKPIVHFFKNYSSWKSAKNMVADFIVDLNNVIDALQDNNVLSYAKTSGIHEIVDVKDEFVTPHIKSVLLRKSVTTDYTLDLSKSVVDIENFITDDSAFETHVALTFLRKKLTSQERGISFELSIKDLTKLLKTKNCYYSGLPLTLTGMHVISLDRKDATKGYTVDNTVACSSFVNSLKNDLLDDGIALRNMGEKALVKMLESFKGVL